MSSWAAAASEAAASAAPPTSTPPKTGSAVARDAGSTLGAGGASLAAFLPFLLRLERVRSTEESLSESAESASESLPEPDSESELALALALRSARLRATICSWVSLGAVSAAASSAAAAAAASASTAAWLMLRVSKPCSGCVQMSRMVLPRDMMAGGTSPDSSPSPECSEASWIRLLRMTGSDRYATTACRRGTFMLMLSMPRAAPAMGAGARTRLSRPCTWVRMAPDGGELLSRPAISGTGAKSPGFTSAEAAGTGSAPSPREATSSKSALMPSTTAWGRLPLATYRSRRGERWRQDSTAPASAGASPSASYVGMTLCTVPRLSAGEGPPRAATSRLAAS